MHRFYPEFVGDPGALGLLILRVAAGWGLMLHGYPKLIVATSWMGPTSTIPGWLQALSTVAEFGGGLALLLGLLTPLVSVGIACNMAVALFTVHFANRDPFVLPEGMTGASYELALLYLAIAFMFMFVGPGTHSLDNQIFNRGRVPAERSRAREKVWR